MQLRPDQIEDLALLMNNERFMLLSDPGCGKTPPACCLMWWLWSEHEQRSVFVMPSTLLKKNRKELLQWSEFAEDEVIIYGGEKISSDRPKVLLMTYDRWRISWRYLVERFPDINTIVVDEWHLGYKTFDSKRNNEMRAALQKIKRLVPMSGSMIAGRLDSCYSAIDMIEPRYYSGPEHFRAVHAITDEYGKLLAWTNHDRLSKILMAHCTSRSFKDIFGEQAKVIQVEVVDMAPLQREKYDLFQRDALLELEDRFLDGSNPGVNALRCLQIMETPEHVKLPIAHDPKTGKPTEWKIYDLVAGKPTGKDERLQIHLADHRNTGKRLAIFGTFHAEVERIARLSTLMGLRTAVIHGGILSRVRGQIDEDFNAGKFDVVCATCKTAGVGLNWPFLEHVIFSSLSYQDDAFYQAYMRAMRGVRKNPLLITVLAYSNSLDFRKMEIVERKSRDANRANPSQQVIDFGAVSKYHMN